MTPRLTQILDLVFENTWDTIKPLHRAGIKHINAIIATSIDCAAKCNAIEHF